VAGYVIAQPIEILDPAAMDEYRKGLAPTLEQYGGKTIIRGGRVEVREGDWSAKPFIVIEFPSFERAKEWYESAEYAGPKKIRHSAARTNLALVEGV